MRYFVEFSFFGKAYHGWQRQPNAVTVQEIMEEVFSTLIGARTELLAAGRTDTGVHAKQMFAHFDTLQALNAEEFVHKANAFLPDDIALHKLYDVDDKAHARFDAIERTYDYWILRKKDPFFNHTAHYVKRSLDLKAMNAATKIIMEYEDFKCFSRSNTDVKTYICDIKNASWIEEDEKLIFTITADRFLRNMVRAIVGTLLEVGTDKLRPKDVKTIIKSRDRSQAGPSVPAKGLYLSKVLYPPSLLSINE